MVEERGATVREERADMTLHCRRIMLAKMLLVLTGIVFITELAVFFVFHPYALPTGTMGRVSYLLFFVMLPSLFNLFISIFCLMYQKNPHVLKHKNLVLVTAASFMCLSVCFYHGEIFAVMGAFSVPVIISTLFGSRKLNNYACVLNAGLLFVCLLHAFIGTSELLHMFMINAAASYVMFFSVYLLSRILIEYNREVQERILNDYRVQQALKKKANSDPLTKLYNQSAYCAYINHAIRDELIEDGSILLAILDIDDFKKVNDTYGHSAGNEVLISLAEALRRCFCETHEFTARYGGEEFVVVFRHGDWRAAVAKVEAFRIAFSELTFTVLDGNSVSFSVGMAASKRSDYGADRLFDRADNALYRAKEKGKNRTIFYTEEGEDKVI